MSQSKLIHNSHNVSDIVFHFVCPTKYRRVVIDNEVDEHLKQICEGIEFRYDYIRFLEIGTDKDHVHFLIQSTPNYSPAKIITIIKSITEKRIFAECPKVKQSKIITIIKSITAKRIFAENPKVKQLLWGGSFWSDGYFVSSVGKHTSEKAVREYVKNQGKENEYKQLYLNV